MKVGNAILFDLFALGTNATAFFGFIKLENERITDKITGSEMDGLGCNAFEILIIQLKFQNSMLNTQALGNL